ncbi:MAG: flagellar biosynthesis protein FlgL [Cereibacter sphaeroides]|uniref:Flagellar biosynthesis protein FlgL n=1 Tax=Cereibacter sphaeroides TaxID=1063 RepID=A0A2W5U2S1_CERSP|nr:MAG: flagellar biosynthesis protein FlgL [Cereibacter sphaeroides]
MTLSSIGDRARSFTMQNQTTRLKVELDRRSFEATTGRSGDIGQLLKGDFTPLSTIDASIARLGAYKTATTEAALATSAMQTVLATMDGLASQLGASLVTVASPGNPVSIDAAGTDALTSFRTAVAAINGRLGDRTLFAGVETRMPALAPAENILDAMMVAVAGSLSASEVEFALDAWFASSIGYVAEAYLGGAALGPMSIAADEAVTVDVTANDPAIRETLKGLGMAALLARGVLAADFDQRAVLAGRAGTVLIEGATSRSTVAARIGTAEARIAGASARNSAEVTALGIARTGIAAIDPYEAATELTNAETQLDTLYAITARLSRLSLASYL